MTEGIEGVTRAALLLALDAASLRQQAHAANIANAGADGHAPLRVDFESQLADARREMADSGRLDARSIAKVRPQLLPADADEGRARGPVRLDLEAADMARNALHYQALVKGLSRHLSILSMAAGDGRK